MRTRFLKLRLLLLATALLPPLSAAAQEDDAAKGRERRAGPLKSLMENVRSLRRTDGDVTERDQVEHKLIVIRLSEELFTSIIDRDVDEQVEVRDVILETPVTGLARTTGRPWVNLVPHETQAAFEVVFEGTTVSRSVGRNGPAVIYSRSTTQFCATKQVRFEPGRGFHAMPAQINAQTSLVIEGVDATTRCRLVSRLVRRRAWREAQAKHGQALAIVHAKAERRVRSVFDAQLEKGLARLNRASNLRGMALNLLAWAREPQYVCCSTEQYVEIAASALGREALPIELPRSQRVRSPIQVWIHKSVPGPRIAGLLTRFDWGRRGLEELTWLSQSAAAALLGLELAAGAGEFRGAADEPPDVALTTVDDWIVIEIAQEGSRASQSLMPLRR